ncbi:hypothetical protein B0T21DRAFT_384489 [Apiosordaria backusii]|uniref:F-box domain-containing protein n=1 Tax=Apiosordaria backusii TaxID=314023 RepID=A0AA40BK45_9PEZI|nr:hypothetical protein B0T21DRAFT_384489 [Apiosordaria backusii]
MAQERQGPQGNDQQLESVVNFPQDRAMSPIQDIRDHLIVARLHNIEYSPLYRIPKELFLIILKQFDLNITADMAAIFCLARVSSLLRRHVLESYKKPDDSYFYHWSICRTVGAQNMTRHLLRKDLLCNTCLSRSDLRMTRTGEVVSRHPRGRSLWNGCKFGGPKVMGIGPLYCSGCAVIHHHRHFSATQRKTKGSERVCIAREGVLRLCEHQQIRWADIERHLVDDHSEKENHMDSSSNDHRQDDNSRKLPPGYETCLPLQLNEVKNENHSVHGVYLTKSARPADSNWRCLITNYYRVISVGMGTWRDRLRHGSDKKARIIPPHEWLHAVDPDSYQLDDDTSKFGNMWPICKDPSCRNYYRTFQSGICNEYYARTLFDKNYY